MFYHVGLLIADNEFGYGASEKNYCIHAYSAQEAIKIAERDATSTGLLVFYNTASPCSKREAIKHLLNNSTNIKPYMTTDEAFIHCLENKIKGSVPRNTYNSYQRRHAAGQLKDKTMHALLAQHGYTVLQKVEWRAPEGTAEQYYDIAYFDKSNKRFTVKNVKAVTETHAKVLAGVEKGQEAENVTGSMRKLVKFINRVIEDNING